MKEKNQEAYEVFERMYPEEKLKWADSGE